MYVEFAPFQPLGFTAEGFRVPESCLSSSPFGGSPARRLETPQRRTKGQGAVSV